MAEESKTGAKTAKKKHEPTKRTVLVRADALILPAGVDQEKVKEAAKLLGAARTVPKEVWWVAGEFDGNSKVDSVEAYTGRAGEVDTKTGTFRAVPAKSFAGAVKLSAPEKPRVEKEIID